MRVEPGTLVDAAVAAARVALILWDASVDRRRSRDQKRPAPRGPADPKE